MRTPHVLLLLGAALMWAGHARAADAGPGQAEARGAAGTHKLMAQYRVALEARDAFCRDRGAAWPHLPQDRARQAAGAGARYGHLS